MPYMPQMSPLWWPTLITTFWISMSMIMITMHSMYNPTMNLQKKEQTYKMLKYSWKW